MSLINYLTRIHFADDVLEEALRAEAFRLGVARILVVADRDSLASGLIERLSDCLRPTTTATLFGCASDSPSDTDCRSASDLYRAQGCDGMVAVGKAGSINLAKACGILASHDGPLLNYAAVEGGITRIRNRLPPIIAVPTTAGSGAEVGCSAAIRFDDGRKLELISPFLIPRVAICDPTLTLGLPPQLTADAGMEALTHCIETYIGTAFNPPADAIALDGVRRIAANLPRAVECGSDLDARRDMMVAAISGALALQKGLGGVHAMSHALESLDGLDLSHGTLNGILLPHVLAFNAPAVADRYAALQDAVAPGRAAGLPEIIQRFGRRIGLPARLGQLGLTRAAVERAAPIAEKDHANSTGPRRARATDYLHLLCAAL